jgi:uncharacterized Zn finger protein
MECPYCGYNELKVQHQVYGGNEWWRFECPRCGLIGRPAWTLSEAKKNCEEDAVKWNPLGGC